MVISRQSKGLYIMNNTIRISKPFAKSFNTLLGGKVVSYSPRSSKVAIGNQAVVVPKETMQEIVDTSNAYGEKFRLVYAAWNTELSN